MRSFYLPYGLLNRQTFHIVFWHGVTHKLPYTFVCAMYVTIHMHVLDICLHFHMTYRTYHCLACFFLSSLVTEMFLFSVNLNPVRSVVLFVLAHRVATDALLIFCLLYIRFGGIAVMRKKNSHRFLFGARFLLPIYFNIFFFGNYCECMQLFLICLLLSMMFIVYCITIVILCII